MRRAHRGSITWWGLGLAVLAACGVSGCSKPLIEGAQVTDRPVGFLFDANATAARKVFPGRRVVDQRGYFTPGEDNACSIMITEYEGPTSYEEVRSAREVAAARYGHSTDYGAVDATVIDERPAWGYLVTQHYRGEISSLTYTAIVSYAKDDRTYTVEFYASDPRYMNEDFLAETVKTFTVN
jgi:hypothetical protein